MNKKQILGYTVNTLFILGSIGIIIAFRTSYVPNLLAFILGLVIAIIALSIVLYEIYTYKEESATGIMKQGRNKHKKVRIFFLFMIFWAFVAMGVYGVSYPLHILMAKEQEKNMLTVPAKPKNKRLFRCSTRVAILEPKTRSYVKTYCAKPEDYALVKSSVPIDRFPQNYRLLNIVYERSPFGHQIINIKP